MLPTDYIGSERICDQKERDVTMSFINNVKFAYLAKRKVNMSIRQLLTVFLLVLITNLILDNNFLEVISSVLIVTVFIYISAKRV